MPKATNKTSADFARMFFVISVSIPQLEIRSYGITDIPKPIHLVCLPIHGYFKPAKPQFGAKYDNLYEWKLNRSFITVWSYISEAEAEHEIKPSKLS